MMFVEAGLSIQRGGRLGWEHLERQKCFEVRRNTMWSRDADADAVTVMHKATTGNHVDISLSVVLLIREHSALYADDTGWGLLRFQGSSCHGSYSWAYVVGAFVLHGCSWTRCSSR
jgi:hypothetical protein